MRAGTMLAVWRFGSVILVAYWTVLVAELVGDKTIYTVTSLALRFRAGIVFATMTLAFAGKMMAAVVLGKVLVQVPFQWAAIFSAVAFFSTALFIWFKESERSSADAPASNYWSRTTLVSFASLFFTEWGDPGQIATVALTVQFHSSLATWMGGTLAMMTKGGLAMVVGVKLHDRLPRGALRTLASVSCCVLGVLAVGELVFPSPS